LNLKQNLKFQFLHENSEPPKMYCGTCRVSFSFRGYWN